MSETPDWARGAVSTLHSVLPKPAPYKAPAVLSDFELEARRDWLPERDELWADLMLVEPPRFMTSLWGREDGGWRDSRTGDFFSYAAMRQMLDARIEELGLSAAMIREYQISSHPIAEEQERLRLSFAERMERFRAGDHK